MIELEFMFLFLGFNGGGKLSILCLISVVVLLLVCGFMVLVCKVKVFRLDVVMFCMMFIDSLVDNKSFF